VCLSKPTVRVEGGAAFVATWTSFKLGKRQGLFSCSAIPKRVALAAIAPAGASHCQRAPLRRRARRDFLGAPLPPRVGSGSEQRLGNDSRFRASHDLLGFLTSEDFLLLSGLQ